MLPSGGELLLIVLVVILFFGSKELPKVMRTMGKWTAIFKTSMNDIRREFNRITIEEELKARDEEEREKYKKSLESKPEGETLSLPAQEAATESGKGRPVSRSIEVPAKSGTYKFEDEELTRIKEEAKKKAAALEKSRKKSVTKSEVKSGSKAAGKAPSPKKKAASTSSPKRTSSPEKTTAKKPTSSATVKKPASKTAKKTNTGSAKGSTTKPKAPKKKTTTSAKPGK